MNNNSPSLNSNNSNLPSSSSSGSGPISKNPHHKVNGTDNNGHAFCTTGTPGGGGGALSNNVPSGGTAAEHPCNTCQLQQRSNGTGSTPPNPNVVDSRRQGGANNANSNSQIATPELSSTTEEEEDCGDSDDQYCVYTYKGDGSSQQPSRLAADLPSSFFKFHPSDSSSSCPPSSSSSEIPSLEPSSSSTSSRCCPSGSRLQNGSVLNPAVVEANSSNPNNNALYSPDMDFLEMDFDPGGSGDGCCDGDDEDENEDNAVRDHLYLGGGAAGTFSFSRGQPVATPGPGSSGGNGSGNSNPVVLNNDDHASAAVVMSKLVVTRPNLGGGCSIPSSSSSSSDSNAIRQRNDKTSEPVAHCSKRSYNFTENSPANKNPLLSTGGSDEIKLRLVKSVTLPEFGSSSSSKILPGVSSSCNTTSSSSSRAMAMSISAPVFQDKLEGPCPQVIPAGKASEDSMELEVDGVMIWTVQEAQEISISQIGKSACGATACLNVLSALGCIMTTLSPEFVSNCVGTRLRAEDADLPEYLLSRSSAGTTHEDLIAGIHRASNGLIYGRFFHIKPNTPPGTLNKWLLHWICKGAVPIATLNLQVRRPGEFSSEIPDAWHHQMIFGVTRQGIFLTNPLECVPTAELIPQLSSSSVLLIRRDDITRRKGPRTDLRKLARFADYRWNEMNVLGQVSNMLLEEMPVLNGSAGLARRTRTAHVSVPAAYKAGITLFIRESNSTSCALLKDAPEF